MFSRSTLLLVGLATTLLLAVALDSAGAFQLSLSNPRFRATWTSLRIFNEEFGADIRCPATLEGSFHSASIRKVNGALIGAVTRGVLRNESCAGGHATLLQETLPWHLTYEGFNGVLPDITSVQLLVRRYAYRIEFVVLGSSIRCLYRDFGRAEENLTAVVTRNTTNGNLTDWNWNPSRPGVSSGGFCPQFTQLEGTGEVFQLGSTARIGVSLIGIRPSVTLI
jgi:hypothetical protein